MGELANFFLKVLEVGVFQYFDSPTHNLTSQLSSQLEGLKEGLQKEGCFEAL